MKPHHQTYNNFYAPSIFLSRVDHRWCEGRSGEKGTIFSLWIIAYGNTNTKLLIREVFMTIITFEFEAFGTDCTIICYTQKQNLF